MQIFSTWGQALKFIFKDPINFVLFLIPAIVAFALYAILGFFIFTEGPQVAQSLIFKYHISKEAGIILYYLITGLLLFLFFILVNWTFVLIIGLIAAPFNDMLSARIEKKIRGEEVVQNRSNALSAVFKRFASTFVTEFKKIVIIVIFTVLAAGLNFIPVLYPVAVLILALLMSAQFLDYSWSRHGWSAGRCMKDVIKYFPSNLVSGMMFLLLIAVPFINALVPALATSYYTVLWTNRQMKHLSNG